MICACGMPLNESITSKDGATKSCPRCSVLAGVHCFHPIDSFGYRTESESGRTFIQSYCRPCRKNEAAERPAFICGGISQGPAA